MISSSCRQFKLRKKGKRNETQNNNNKKKEGEGAGRESKRYAVKKETQQQVAIYNHNIVKDRGTVIVEEESKRYAKERQRERETERERQRDIMESV